MSDFGVSPASAQMTLAALARAAGLALPDSADSAAIVYATAPLDLAGPSDVAIHPAGADPRDLNATQAGACFVTADDARHVPPDTVALVVADPWAAFCTVAVLLTPRVGLPPAGPKASCIDPRAIVHPTARLESGVSLEAGVVVGACVELGTGTIIGANSVIGAGVCIGRGCAIDAHVTIHNALIGDRVVVHAGSRLGVSGGAIDQTGTGSRRVGRVIVQDSVEIGPGAIVEQGRLGDTTIGEWARLAAQVVVKACATVDRHTIVGQAGFS